VFDGYSSRHEVDGDAITLGLFDTMGQEEYDRLRPLSYPCTDVFMLCFSLCDRESYENVTKRWQHELTSHLPTARLILVATKLDIDGENNDESANSDNHNTGRTAGKRAVSTSEGLELQKLIGAESYVECSAVTREGVNQVFEEMMRAGVTLRPTPETRRCGCIVL